MLRMVIGVIILVAAIFAAILLFIWIGNQDHDGWFQQWLLIAAVSFLLATGILTSGLLIERSLRDR